MILSVRGGWINPSIDSIDTNAGIGIRLSLVIGTILYFCPLSSVCSPMNWIDTFLMKTYIK